MEKELEKALRELRDDDVEKRLKAVEKLAQKGKFGQSFNDVIEELIEDKETS